MVAEKYVDYGSAKALVGDAGKAAGKFALAARERPTVMALVASLFLPCAVFAATFWLRSFEIRHSSEDFASLMCRFIFLLPCVCLIMSLLLRGVGRSTKSTITMMLFGLATLLAWSLGYAAGDVNFQSNMRPFYEINELNSYPSVDPSKYGGGSVMDAGQIEFAKGSRLWLDKSTGFKDGIVYCVAPIVLGSNVTQSVFDFWAVGTNCCSGHISDFHCGEYYDPRVRKGLRLMDADKADMFRLVVKKAEAEFHLHAPHPVLLEWVSDPSAEVKAWQQDGFKCFILACFSFCSLQIFLVVGSVLLLAHLPEAYKWLHQSSWHFLVQ